MILNSRSGLSFVFQGNDVFRRFTRTFLFVVRSVIGLSSLYFCRFSWFLYFSVLRQNRGLYVTLCLLQYVDHRTVFFAQESLNLFRSLTLVWRMLMTTQLKKRLHLTRLQAERFWNLSSFSTFYELNFLCQGFIDRGRRDFYSAWLLFLYFLIF